MIEVQEYEFLFRIIFHTLFENLKKLYLTGLLN